MAFEWLTAALPFIKDNTVAAALKEQVNLLVMQRDDAIRELDKADATLAKTEKKVTVLERENENLKQQVADLKPTTDLSLEAQKILFQLFISPQTFTTYTLAQGFGLGESVCQYHLDTLMSKGLIELANWVRVNNSPDSYRISAMGRAFVMDKNLAGQ